MGGKRISAGHVGRIGTAARSIGRIGEERGDVGRASGSVGMFHRQIAGLEAQFQREVNALTGRTGPATEQFGPVVIKPKKSGVFVQFVVLGWVPEQGPA